MPDCLVFCIKFAYFYIIFSVPALQILMLTKVSLPPLYSFINRNGSVAQIVSLVLLVSVHIRIAQLSSIGKQLIYMRNMMSRI